jgi:hypothetical protein
MRSSRPASPAVTLLTSLLLVLPQDSAFALEPPGAPETPSESDGPHALFDRLRAAYQERDADAYAALLADDFRFEFGDDENRAKYPDGFDRDDEVATARHLFEGFVDASGQPRPRARKVALEFGGLAIGFDPEFPCDPAHHLLADVPQVRLAIEFVDGTRMVAPGHHAFWLVRADSAGGDTLGWRIRRWVEEPAESLLVVPECPVACADSDSVSGTLGVVASAGDLPLWSVVPNPSRRGETATLAFDVPREGEVVEAALYDIAGRRVAVLAEGPSSAGRRTLTWDGRDAQGEATRPGVYFLRVRVGDLVRRDRLVRIP